MTSRRYLNPVVQYLDSAGSSLAGAEISFFASGTSTFQNTYSDEALSIPNSNPVICDGSGRIPNIFLADLEYKVIMKTGETSPGAGDQVQIWERDPVASNGDGGGSAGFVAGKSSYAALDATTSGDSELYYVQGRVTEGDGGQGFWAEIPVGSSALTEDGGTARVSDDTLSMRVRVGVDRTYNAMWYAGVVGDHTPATPASGTDNTSALNTAMAAISANITQNDTNVGRQASVTFWVPKLSAFRENFFRCLDTLDVPAGITWRSDATMYFNKVDIYEPAMDFAQGSHLELLIAHVNGNSGIRLGGGSANNAMQIGYFKLHDLGKSAAGTTPFVDLPEGAQFRGDNFFMEGACEVVGGFYGFDWNGCTGFKAGVPLLATNSHHSHRIITSSHIQADVVANSCNETSGEIDTSNNIKSFIEAYFDEDTYGAQANNGSGYAVRLGANSSGNPVESVDIKVMAANTNGVAVDFSYITNSTVEIQVVNGQLQTTEAEPTTHVAEADVTGFTTARQAGTTITINGTGSTAVWNGSRPTALRRILENGTIEGNDQLKSTVATGTAPLSVASTTVVPNLNADTVDGLEGASFAQGSTTITAGEGLTGGGDLSANRTIDVDIPGLTADATPVGSTDFLMTFDDTASEHKKVLIDNLPGGGATYTSLTDTDMTGLADHDMTYFDSASGDHKPTGSDMRFDNATGILNLADLAVTGAINASTAGIELGGTAAENTLNEYEEQGTWTPVLDGQAVSPTSVTYSTQLGKFTRVGNLVWASFDVRTSAVTLGPASGALLVTGFPFTAGQIGANQGGVGAATGFSGGFFNTLIVDTSSTASRFFRDGVQIVVTELSGTDALIATVIYII